MVNLKAHTTITNRKDTRPLRKREEEKAGGLSMQMDKNSIRRDGFGCFLLLLLNRRLHCCSVNTGSVVVVAVVFGFTMKNKE